MYALTRDKSDVRDDSPAGSCVRSKGLYRQRYEKPTRSPAVAFGWHQPPVNQGVIDESL